MLPELERTGSVVLTATGPYSSGRPSSAQEVPASISAANPAISM